MTDAKDIQLTKEMLKLLKQLAQGKSFDWSLIEATEAAQSLYYYSLVYVSRSGNAVRITEKGQQALLHYKNSAKERRGARLHDWLIAIFSTIGGALLSKPVWTVIEWVKQVFAELP